ncbi:hypothetical protein AC579_9206 [Pseudocercospora musae]|uniref:Heterokaryon incompatibility domain-containing protein n=1 Tax=Pseudocercospora musae TaxID=113226 RepID=A0A139I053_9PEZI|nr:hypothetical protein AC579_9206 [Pseudocercospora musae]
MSLHCRRTCTILMYDPPRRMQPPNESTESFISPCSTDTCDYGIDDRSIQENANHPSIIQRVKFWLRECSEEHNTCPETRPESYPKRLLDLQKATLPATIQDAIDVARELNISHLWVDVLCIVQDDDGTDWKAHAGMMHHIYGEAKLALCACSALSSTEGFRSDQELSPVARRSA